MDLSQVGEMLKARREELGMSIEEVMDRTKISRRNILAIESGEVKDLPHPVYAKGFIKNYAGLLGLDPEEIAGMVHFPIRDEDLQPPEDIKLVAPSRPRNRLLPSLVILLLLVLIVTGIVWYVVQSSPGRFAPPAQEPAVEQEQEALPEETMPQEPLTREEPLAPQGFPDTTPDDEPAAPGLPVPDEEPSVQPGLPEAETTEAPDETAAQEPAADEQPAEVVAEAEQATEEPAAQPEAADEPEPAEETAETDLPDAGDSPAVALGDEEAPPGANVLQLIASQDCWVGATIDEAEDSKSYYVYAGQTKNVFFYDQVSLVIGNPAGLDIRLNGEPYPFEYEPGKPVRFTIP